MATVPPCLFRCISTFNASRELPSGVEDSLVLWLNKVSESVCNFSKEETTALLLESDPLQRRRNKVKLMNSPEMRIPPVDQLGAGITDGQCLAALLLHYCQDSVKWSGMLSAQAISCNHILICPVQALVTTIGREKCLTKFSLPYMYLEKRSNLEQKIVMYNTKCNSLKVLK